MPGKSKYTLGSQLSSDLVDVTLPSGLTCQAKRPGVEGLITAGLLDNFDELTALIQTEHVGPKTAGTRQTVTSEQTQNAVDIFMKDKDKLASVIVMVDRLTVHVITEPIVWIDYQLKDELDEVWAERQKKATEDQAVAVRRIDLNDKMYLLNWAVGGSSDLAAFRTGTKELLGDLATS